MKNKILIVSPHPKLLGGVANHYIGLNDYWTNNIEYEYYGKRESIPAFITFFYDLIKYFLKLIFSRPNVVLINPSFRRYQLIRDGIYLLIANMLGVKVVTFIHGWDDKYSKKIIHSSLLFSSVYNKSTFIYVLFSSFKSQLLEMGIKKPIILTTTKVDNKLLENFDIKTRVGNVKNILFLARVEREKGVLIVIEAFNILKKKYKESTLTIVGSGSFLEEAKQFAENHLVQDIHFTGALYGMDVADQYRKSDIYILPTTHGEGMPTTVLEAMVFGLPIITRAVGGLNDFFDTKTMGTLIDDLLPDSYALEMESYILNSDKTRNKDLFNHNYASNRFLANSVVDQIEKDINNHCFDTEA